MRPDRILLLGLFLALLGLTVVLIALSIPLGVYTIFFGNISRIYDYTSLAHPYLWIGPVFTYLPVSVSAGGWFLAATAVYVVFFAYSLRQKESPASAVRGSFGEGFGALFSSPFLVTIISIGFLTFSSSIIDSAVSSSGVGIGGPSSSDDPFSLLIGFTEAPLVEEFGFRLLLIGVVAAILCMGRSRRDMLGALWRPSTAVEGLAIGSGASLIIWAAIGFSAASFGACHVYCGSTWDPGKFPEAAFGGLVLAVLYVKYGFHVAVLTHWGVDYFGSVYSFFGQAVAGIPWYSNTQEYVGQYVVDLDMLLLFGLASFLVVVYVVARALARRRGGKLTGEFDKGPIEGGPVGP
jgi:hypothetical protein